MMDRDTVRTMTRRLLTEGILMQADFVRFLYKMGLLSYDSADKIMDRLTIRALDIEFQEDVGGSSATDNKKRR